MLNIKKLKGLKEGDKITINNEVFELIKIELGAEPDNKRDVRKYLSLQLHNVKDNSLFPGFELRIYDDEEIKFFKLNYEKPKFPKDFKPKMKGGWVEYKEIKI